VSDHPVVVSVAGGAGSGRTTVVTGIPKGLDTNDVLVTQHESYGRNRSHLCGEKSANINYDHPNALDTSVLTEHLRKLSAGQAVEMPIYDSATHTGESRRWRAEAHQVIAVKGF
jgi:uridine kinase